MPQVIVTAEREVGGSAQQVRAALADYAETRPKILTAQFSEYRVQAGGQGAGTQVHWRFAATSKRVRDQLIAVSEPGDGSLVESDQNSTMVTTWDGAGGIGGFFERTFAPKGLSRVYQEMIGKLDGVG